VTLEAVAILRRQDKRQHHLRIHPVAILLQLPEPEIESILVRIASQVRDVFNEHKRIVKFFVVERLAVCRVENQCAVGDGGRAIDDLEDHTRFVTRGGFVDQRRSIGTRKRNSGRLTELVDKLRRRQGAINLLKLGPRNELRDERLLVAVDYVRIELVVNDYACATVAMSAM
jgi:hypothetical protein